MSLQGHQPLPISRDYVMVMPNSALALPQSLTPSPIADLRLEASTMTGAKRRAFEDEMTLKYCAGNPLQAETALGWSRRTVALGLAESRTGLLGLGAPSAFSGRKRWEELHRAGARGPAPPARSACAPSPAVPHHPGLYAADSPSRSGGL